MKKILLTFILITGLCGIFSPVLNAQQPSPPVRKCFPFKYIIAQSSKHICPIEVCIEQDLVCTRQECYPSTIVNPRNCTTIKHDATADFCYWAYEQEGSIECAGSCRFSLLKITFRNTGSGETITITGSAAQIFISILNGTAPPYTSLLVGAFQLNCNGEYMGTDEIKKLYLFSPSGSIPTLQLMP